VTTLQRNGNDEKFTRQVLKEVRDGEPVAAVAERHGIDKNYIYRWKGAKKERRKAAKQNAPKSPDPKPTKFTVAPESTVTINGITITVKGREISIH
jgi:transposase-like protein